MAQLILSNGTLVEVAGIGVNPNEWEIDRTYSNQEQYTKKALLQFLRSELLYDIKNIAYVSGDVMPEDAQHTRHQVQDIGETGNIDRVTRMLDLAHAECQEILYRFTKVAVSQETTMDDKLGETVVYKIAMLVPDDFSLTTANLLEKYIHEFMIYRVLADWFGIASPDSSHQALWLAKLDAAKEGIETCLNRMMLRARKSQTPF